MFMWRIYIVCVEGQSTWWVKGPWCNATNVSNGIIKVVSLISQKPRNKNGFAQLVLYKIICKLLRNQDYIMN